MVWIRISIWIPHAVNRSDMNQFVIARYDHELATVHRVGPMKVSLAGRFRKWSGNGVDSYLNMDTTRGEP